MSPQQISLLMFSSSPVRAGAEEHILQLLHGLDRNVFRLYFACHPQLAELIEEDLPPDVKLFKLTLDHLSDFAGAFQLAKIVRKQGIQILHSHMSRASVFASPIGWLGGAPLIVDTAHVREFWRSGRRGSYAVDRFSARFVHSTIAVSNAVAHYLIEQKGIPAAKITVIPTAPALRFSSEGGDRESKRRSLGIGESDRLIVVAARLEPQKGHRFLIEALPAVLQEFPRAQMVCLGEGSLRQELEALVAQRGLAANIRFAGYQTDVWNWFSAADLSVLPSLFEGLPMTALESLAAGCPIVATAVDGTPEVVFHEKTGLLLPPSNPDALAAAIRRMLRDPFKAREMANAGRDFVLDNFSVEKLVQRTQQFYLRAWEQRFGLTPLRVPGKEQAAPVQPNCGGPARSEVGIGTH